MAKVKDFFSFTIRGKIIAAALGAAVMAGGFGLFTLDRLDILNNAAETMRGTSLPSTQLAGQLMGAAQGYRIAEAAYALSTNAMQIDQVETNLRNAEAVVTRLRAAAGPLFAAGEGADRLAGFDAAWKDYAAVADRVRTLVRDNQTQSAASVFKRPSAVAFTRVQDSLNALVDGAIAEAGTVADRGGAVYRDAHGMVLTVVTLCTLLSLAFGAALVRSISRPILDVAGALERLAARDFTVPSTPAAATRSGGWSPPRGCSRTACWRPNGSRPIRTGSRPPPPKSAAANCRAWPMASRRR